MKKLQVDLDLIFQSFGFEDEGLCKEYLDTDNGEVINIPTNVSKVLDGKLDLVELTDWEKELLEEAFLVKEDEENRFIEIPKIKSSFFNNAMESFLGEKIIDKVLKDKLSTALRAWEPMKKFKEALIEYPEELDMWYDFEEEKGREYVKHWLMERGIEVI